ncbi:MAG: hypothetical protein AB7S75_23440 [Desulfococcaceae bacterium]
MRDRIIKFIIMCLVCYGIYFAFANHIIYFGGRDFAILKKQKMSFNNTFNNYKSRKEIQYIGLENVLKNEDLRAAGLGQEFVKRELVTEEELQAAEEKLDSEE